MTAAAPTYTKLPGRGFRRAVFAVTATRCSLWMAPDHLLAVDYTIASEEYRRFYFRDIEAFIVRRTAHRQVWNWIFFGLLLLSAGPLAYGWHSQGEAGFLVAAVAVATFWIVLLLSNSLRGATCQTHIRTAVHLEQLPSLGRLPAARKVLAAVQPRIVAAQGVATPEELTASPWMNASAAPRTAALAAPKLVRADKGRLHGVLFGLLIVEAVLTAVAYVFYDQPISIFSLLALLGGSVVCMIALMRQGDTNLSGFMRNLTKVALGYYILKCLVGFVFMMIFAVRHPGTPLVTGLEMVDEPGFSVTAVSSAGLGAVIGLVGLVALLAHLRRSSAPPAV